LIDKNNFDLIITYYQPKLIGNFIDTLCEKTDKKFTIIITANPTEMNEENYLDLMLEFEEKA